MAEYRAYAVGHDGHLVSSRAFIGDSVGCYGLGKAACRWARHRALEWRPLGYPARTQARVTSITLRNLIAFRALPAHLPEITAPVLAFIGD
jgi:hypothetical protein